MMKLFKNKQSVSARLRPRALRPRRGGLFYLALFMGLAGILRIGDGVGRALAKTDTTETHAEMAAQEPQSCQAEGGASVLLESLRDREARLQMQEKMVAEKEQTLALARSKIDEKLAELELAEQKLAQTIALADQAAEKDVSKLVAMYETMKPKVAAKMFAEMAPDFAAGFLAKMRPDAAAAILAGLEPGQVYTISVVLAGRNAKAPKT
jgi:flagellar motility protein MotE (MotC chaperone)